MHAAGKMAFLADSFLSGLSRGRAIAAAKEAQKQDTLYHGIYQAISQVQQSDAAQPVKDAALKQLGSLQTQVLRDALGGNEGGKGKRGKGNQDQGHPGFHIGNAVRSVLDRIAGSAPSQPADQDQIVNTLNSVMATVRNPANSIQAQNAKLNQVFGQAYHNLVTKNGGKPPTFSEMMADPATRTAYSQVLNANGNRPTGIVAAATAAAEQQEKMNLTAPLNYAKVQHEVSQTPQGRAALADGLGLQGDAKKSYIATGKLPSGFGAPTKYTGEIGQREQALQILNNPKSSSAEKDQARATIKHLDAVGRGAQVRVVAGEHALHDQQMTEALDNVQPGSKEYRNLQTQAANDPSLDLAAWDWLAYDRFDVRGRGKGVQGQVKTIKARAGQIMRQFGWSSGDVFALRGNLKGNTGALAKMTTYSAQVNQFERTLEGAMDVARKLNDEYKRGDYKFVNAVNNAFKTGTGSSEALNLAAQLHTVANEWAKIMQGSTSAAGVAISEADQANAIISKSLSHGQISSLFDNVIQKDIDVRRGALEGEQAAIVNKIRGLTAKQDNSSEQAQPESTTAPPPPGAKLDPKVQSLLSKYQSRSASR